VLPQIFDLFSQARDGQPCAPAASAWAWRWCGRSWNCTGHVQAKSPGLGKGAEFSFRLPRWQPRSAS
jgi:hypothetical protein